mgnify:CR=1 FL=1
MKNRSEKMGYFEDIVKGLYDFTSDTLDNIGNGLSDLNDMARNFQVVRDIEDTIHGAYEWGMDQLRSVETYSQIEKSLERAIIRTLYVPAKQRATERIVERFDIVVKEIGEKTKKTIDSVNSQIDNEIKGEFSKSIQDTVSKENQKWQRLV